MTTDKRKGAAAAKATSSSVDGDQGCDVPSASKGPNVTKVERDPSLVPWSTLRYALLSLALLAVAMYIPQFRGKNAMTGIYYEDSPPIYEVVGKVPEVDWSRDHSLDGMLSNRWPFLMKNGVVEDWPAMRKWTPKYLASKVVDLAHVRSGSMRDGDFVLAAPVLTPRDGNLWLPAMEKFRRDRHDTLNMSMTMFLGDALDGKESKKENKKRRMKRLEQGHRYLYYSGPLQHWDASFLDDIMPNEHLKHSLKFNQTKTTTTNALSIASVWIGRRGVVAHTHFDRSHNFFTQIVGKKRITLFPPSSWPTLYPYPATHEHYQQSQVDFNNPDVEAFPMFPQAEAMTVDVGPGETLYIPPFWWHRVESLTFAVSVSIVSPSEEEMSYQQLVWIPLSFASSLHTTGDRVGALLFYLERMWKRVDHDWSLALFVERMMLDSRYAHMREELVSLSPLYDEFASSECYGARGGKIDPELFEEIDNVAKEAADVINAMNVKGVRDMSVAKYMEVLTCSAVGCANTIAIFDTCF
eukprot:TRINITY_DN5558_c0_g1_i2.p1 TRINITY_DN5558_c0_g1~~TRINITY_DN5558_c0_g1_i2.p1  ORF type:complete len:524 (-),score=116.96 TRINITY_DN5558_c0_g1_i2:89-1660(-)